MLRDAVAVLATVVLGPGAASAAVSLVEVPEFGSNPGKLQMFTYVPDGLPSRAPVVVVAHDVAGCAAGTKRLAARVLGDLARSGYPGYRRRRPRMSLWHGSADRFLVLWASAHYLLAARGLKGDLAKRLP